MMTYSLRNKTIALATAIVFALSLVMMPVGTAFAADIVDITGAYEYVEAEENVAAGRITVAYEKDPSPATEVHFKVMLPSGVEFARTPGEEVVNADVYGKGVGVDFVASTSRMLHVFAVVYGVYGVPNPKVGWNDGDRIKFDFGHENENLWLDIDDDFRGDLRVNVEVQGFDKHGNRVWVESDTVTIARVVEEKEVIVTAEDPKAVSVGQDREAAKITIKELLPGTLKGDDPDTWWKREGYLKLEIRTDGVEFDADSLHRDHLAYTHLDIDYHRDRGEDYEFNIIKIWIEDETENFAGRIELTPILDIDPDVTGEIRIEVSACEINEDVLDDTTLTVATVGDIRAKIDEVKYNDGIIYAGVKEEDLDTEFKVVTIGGADFKVGDMITFELSAGKLVTAPNVSPCDDVEVVLYDECGEYPEHYGAFYVTVEDEIDEIKISGLKIKLEPDVEPGDLKLRVGGDYGDLGEVVIARIEKPFTVTAREVTEVVHGSAMNRVADIVITEANEGVLDEDIRELIYLKLPEGIVYTREPEVEVTKGDIELGDIRLIEDNQTLLIEIDDGSTEKSTITISDIYYSVKPWAAVGDVEVRIEDVVEDVFTTVVNARVVDERLVTATFTKADDEVEIRNGRALLRVNVLCDVMGLEKSWDPVNRTAYFIRPRDGRVVAFPIGENKMILNGIEVPISQGGVIINDFTHVPIRYIQMAFGGELHWDNVTKTVTYTFTK
ncbi:copper amine oxidase N-terminal domain-containing protein [Peptococcaceae bacterium]|nr:copper amine oxidase N-terminal domain-containing protein [Peptococcaceae bacterium]